MPVIVAEHGSVTSPAVSPKRPRWGDVYNGYPLENRGKSNENDQDAATVFRGVFGSKYYEENRHRFQNACATRVSLALVNAEMSVRKDFMIQKEGTFVKDGFIAKNLVGNGLITSARNLQKWLSGIWGPADKTISGNNTLDKVAAKINGRNGVYIILDEGNNEFKNHATLWLGEHGDVIGGNNLTGKGGTIYFWELKGVISKKACTYSYVKDVAEYIVEEMLTNMNSEICRKLIKLNNDSVKFSIYDAIPVIQTAEVIRKIKNKINAYMLWKDLVGSRRIWDHKILITKKFGEWTCNKKEDTPLKFFFDIWSNIHYGFVGKHIGFLDVELLNGAGLAQISDNNKSLTSWNTWKNYFKNRIEDLWDADFLGAFDDSEDQQAVKIGFDLYDNHKNNLTADVVIETLLEKYNNGKPIRIKNCEHH
jgi:hypothetical protein